MLVTDIAMQHMDQGTRSVALSLRRIFGRWRRRRPAPPLRLVPRHSRTSRVAGTGRDRPLAAMESPSPPEILHHRPPANPDSGQTHTDVPAREVPFKWRRHPQLRALDRNSGERSGLDPHGTAEAAALRGLFLARGERLGEARAAFAKAAADPSIDLTDLPGFWHLSRGAMLIAAVAYEDVERFRDAAALSARVRTRYRPRAMASVAPLERRADSNGGR